MRSRLFALFTVVMLLASACAAPPAAGPQPSPTAAQAPAPTSASTQASASGSGTLDVFAAASLTASFNEIGKAFEAKNPGLKVIFNYAGSQQLAQQINSGAPADVVASANKAQMDAALKSGRIDASAANNFVKNRLVVIYPKTNTAGIQTLQDLAKPGLKLVLADKAVPVGQYALTFLDNAARDASFGATYKDAVLKNVASYEQDVKSVLAKVELGEADAGIVYTTDAATDTQGKTVQIPIPDTLNVIATYPIAALKDSPNAQMAQAFVDYVLSADGQAVLTKYGFITVSE